MTKPVFYLLLILGAAVIMIGMWQVATQGSALLGWAAVVAGLLLLCAPAVSWRSAEPDKVEQ